MLVGSSLGLMGSVVGRNNCWTLGMFLLWVPPLHRAFAQGYSVPCKRVLRSKQASFRYWSHSCLQSEACVSCSNTENQVAPCYPGRETGEYMEEQTTQGLSGQSFYSVFYMVLHMGSFMVAVPKLCIQDPSLGCNPVFGWLWNCLGRFLGRNPC